MQTDCDGEPDTVKGRMAQGTGRGDEAVGPRGGAAVVEERARDGEGERVQLVALENDRTWGMGEAREEESSAIMGIGPAGL